MDMGTTATGSGAVLDAPMQLTAETDAMTLRHNPSRKQTLAWAATIAAESEENARSKVVANEQFTKMWRAVDVAC